MISENVVCKHEMLLEDDNTGEYFISQTISWGSNQTRKEYIGYNLNKDLDCFATKLNTQETAKEIIDHLAKKIDSIRNKQGGIFLVNFDKFIFCFLDMPMADQIINQDPMPTYLKSLIYYAIDYFNAIGYAMYNIYSKDYIKDYLPLSFEKTTDNGIIITDDEYKKRIIITR